jgi:putative SOS response-associated peptidase YedK
MCGRYDNLIAREAYKLLFNTERLPASNFPPRYNVAPTDQAPTVRVDPRDGTRELVTGRWGLVPWWSKEIPKVPHINARAETVHSMRMFKEAFAKRRALIPATGFFEWQKRTNGKQPYRFQNEDLQPFAFAGLWEFARSGGDDILSATIIVGEPNPLVADLPTSSSYRRPMNRHIASLRMTKQLSLSLTKIGWGTASMIPRRVSTSDKVSGFPGMRRNPVAPPRWTGIMGSFPSKSLREDARI